MIIGIIVYSVLCMVGELDLIIKTQKQVQIGHIVLNLPGSLAKPGAAISGLRCLLGKGPNLLIDKLFAITIYSKK